MEFRLNQCRDVSSFCSEDAFASPRRIRFASEIPPLGPQGFESRPSSIRLRGVIDEGAEAYVSVHGAEREGALWVVRRKDPFPFDLGEHLPVMARRSIVVETPQRRWPASWRHSLSTLLSESSWTRIVADVWRVERICHLCGSVPLRPSRLEGWDEWRTGVGSSMRLCAVRVLCPACLETRCLETASSRGSFDRAFARLAALNRISGDEIHDYRAAFRSSGDQDAPGVVDVDLSWLGGTRVGLHPLIHRDGSGILRRRGSSGGVRVVAGPSGLQA